MIDELQNPLQYEHAFHHFQTVLIFLIDLQQLIFFFYFYQLWYWWVWLKEINGKQY